MAKPRRQTYTLQMYLQKMKELDIRSDQDVQRLSGAWNNNMTNELISSVLNDEYIPPIILGQEDNFQMWLIDGLQRSTALMMFRYGNYKITSSIEEPIIDYCAKVRDAKGEVCIDGNGDIVWENREFDLKNKGYDKLPEELQKKFNEYQIETVIHEGYGMKEISKLVRRYNNHKAMNVSQKAFTFCDRYARKIREILKRKFFIEAPYTKVERKNGLMERIIMETVMCMFHLSDWKTASSKIGEFLNGYSAMEEFDVLDNNIGRLETMVTEDLYSMFTSRDSFILFTLFHRFTQLNMDDGKFADFLKHFKELTEGQDMNEFYGIDKNSSTKDKTVIHKKLDKMETIMYAYLGISKEEDNSLELGLLEFVKENVSVNITQEDIEQYNEVLETLMEGAEHTQNLMARENRPSLVAVVAWSFENDIDLDHWMADYCQRNGEYIYDQKENYLHMQEDLKQYLGLANVA